MGQSRRVLPRSNSSPPMTWPASGPGWRSSPSGGGTNRSSAMLGPADPLLGPLIWGGEKVVGKRWQEPFSFSDAAQRLTPSAPSLIEGVRAESRAAFPGVRGGCGMGRGTSRIESRTTAMLETRIIDRGRGPEVAGTRITVYDVLDYHQIGWHRDRIAATLSLGSYQVEAAIRYIEDHRDEVMADYQRILARHARGNPPALQAKLDTGHERFLAMVRQRREAKDREGQDAGHSGGH